MSVQIPGIPQAASGVALVNHLNDRLRRISEQLGAAGTPGAPGAAGTPGAPGTPGSSVPTGIYLMGTSGNLTPDGVAYVQSTGGATQGPLTGAAHVLPPVSPAVESSFKVQLIQPVSGGGYAVTWDAAYKGLSGVILSLAVGTQAVLEFLVMSATEIQLMNVAQNGWSTS